jgi:hypothetical protein
MLSRLTIDVRDFVAKSATTCHEEEIARNNATMVEVTKSILARRVSNPNSISSMCMTFFLRDDDCISIGHSVEHIMAMHDIDIEFTVLTHKDATHCNLDSMIDYGRLFMLFFDACPIAFGGVTRLCLENLSFGESDIPNILNTCKRLKHLSLSHCCPEREAIVQVEHSQLSELLIVNCHFEKVKLNSLPKLTWMMFWCWKSQDPLLLGHVPLLETVSITNHGLSWPKLVELSKFFGGASPRYLWLGFECEKVPLDKSFC